MDVRSGTNVGTLTALALVDLTSPPSSVVLCLDLDTMRRSQKLSWVVGICVCVCVHLACTSKSLVS